MKSKRTSGLIALISALLISCSTLSTDSSSLNDEIITLKTQQGRAVSVRVLSPPNCEDCTLIVFSHGANASYNRYNRLLIPLAESGYQVVAANHVDSEEHPQRESYNLADSLPTRIEDYKLIVEHFNPSSLISAGHSYGALIALMSGGVELSDNSSISITSNTKKPDAIIALSPPGEIPGYTAQAGFAKITSPLLLVTGTKDILPRIAERWQSRLAAYTAALPGSTYALIYSDMDHYLNGAYGRETKNISTQTQTVMTHLLKANAAFIEHIIEGDRSFNWKDQTTGFAEARSK